MKKKSSTLGLFTLGSRTVLFYKKKLAASYNKNKPLSECSTLEFITADFDTINQYLPDQFSQLEPLLQADIDLAVEKKVDILIIPNITLHETLDRLIKNNNSPSLTIIHPVEATIAALHKEHITQAVIIGSAYTSHCHWMDNYFFLHNIKIIRISEQHTQQIEKIRQQTYIGNDTQQDHQNYNDLINYYQQQAPVVIACTELSILVDESHQHKVFDMSTIQIKAAINSVLALTI